MANRSAKGRWVWRAGRQLLRNILEHKKRTGQDLFTPDDVWPDGATSEAAVRVALCRLVNLGVIERVEAGTKGGGKP